MGIRLADIEWRIQGDGPSDAIKKACCVSCPCRTRLCLQFKGNPVEYRFNKEDTVILALSWMIGSGHYFACNRRVGSSHIKCTRGHLCTKIQISTYNFTENILGTVLQDNYRASEKTQENFMRYDNRGCIQPSYSDIVLNRNFSA